MKNITKKNHIPPCENCETRETSMFCNLEQVDLEKLTKHKIHFHFKKGQTLFYENNHALGVFCIYSGKVVLHKRMNDKSQVIRLARPGSWIGYRALLGGDVYSASATTIENTEACFIPKQTFMALLKEKPDLTNQTIKLLAEDLKEAETKLVAMAQLPARERIIESLFSLAEFYGYESDKMTINGLFARENIGSISGTTTETAIRILSQLNKDKLIELKGKKIRIIDEKKLKQLIAEV